VAVTAPRSAVSTDEVQIMAKTTTATATSATKQGTRHRARKSANRRQLKRAPAATGSHANGKTGSVSPPIRQSKKAAILGLLERPDGAAISDLTAATGWQVHSVRAALTGLRKDGKELIRAKDDAGVTRYRLTAAG
jgi:Protein of unknown function (DUF3489)